MKTNNKIVDEINREETFKEAKDIKLDPNAVFVEFNPNLALEKLLNINTLKIAEKISYAKHITDLLEVLKEEGVLHLEIIMNNFLKEKDEVIYNLLLQTTSLENKYYSTIIAVIIPFLSELLNNINPHLKEEAGKQMGNLLEILNEEDRGKYILTIVLGLAHDDEDENNRIVAVQLLSRMSTIFGKELCEQFVGLEFLSLGEDPKVQVRKEAINNLTSLSKIVSEVFFKSRILPFFLKISNDNSWIVRKACIDILIDISLLCETPARESQLTALILRFLKDSNKWVKISAYKQLGPFISTLTDLKISDKLYEHYIGMTSSHMNSLSPDNEIKIACAYNFPAVLAAFGVEKWPQLRKMFQSMTKKIPEVRKPLACALHEIANIIGPERAEIDLIPILENILQDHVDEIKFGAIKNIANFLEVFSDEKRESLVDVLLILQKDHKKWRIRELIANQIEKLVKIYKPETVFSIISPISFKLCSDPVHIVRRKACKKIYNILLKLTGSYQECVIENINGFFLSKKYTFRQAYILMVCPLMNYPSIFRQHFLSNLISLASDKVTNVKIVLAKCLDKYFKKNVKMKEDKDIIQLILKLRSDQSRDVREVANFINVKELKKEEENKNSEEKSKEEDNARMKEEEIIRKEELRMKEEEEKRRKQEEEERRRREEDEVRRREEEEEKGRRREEEEGRRREEEEGRRREEEKESRRREEEEEEKRRKEMEEEEKRKRQEEEEGRKREEIEKRRREEEEDIRKKEEEIQREKREKEEKKNKEEEEEKKRKEKEEEDRKKREEEEESKMRELEENRREEEQKKAVEEEKQREEEKGKMGEESVNREEEIRRDEEEGNNKEGHGGGEEEGQPIKNEEKQEAPEHEELRNNNY